MTRVKICGITNVADARCATEAGADFIGFILYRKSLRYVTPQRVVAIVQALEAEYGATRPRTVGVFVDEPVARVRGVLSVAGLDLAQLHGAEPVDEIGALYPRAFKAIRPQTLDEAKEAIATYGPLVLDDVNLPQLLADAYHPDQPGGTGTLGDWTIARWLADRTRLMLAGGLAPETVGAAIEAVRPWGVDVSSEVEVSKGIKDHARVRAFIEAVRGQGSQPRNSLKARLA
jgi:phosphoribosylanthranilate isomerase